MARGRGSDQARLQVLAHFVIKLYKLEAFQRDLSSSRAVAGRNTMRKLFSLTLIVLLSVTLRGQTSHPILSLGSPAPDFALPGVAGQIHKLSDYARSRVLCLI